MSEPVGLINTYVCSLGHRTVTVNSAEGATPPRIDCRECLWEGSPNQAESCYCRVDQELRPTHEWYRPEGEELARLDDATREHVAKGGLLLRRIGVAALERHGYRTRGG
jgi:hypothetical protein